MLKNIAPKPRSYATGNARKLRRKMTLPEVILWHWLRQRDAVLRFIMLRAKARLPLHHPAGGPPPRGKLGED